MINLSEVTTNKILDIFCLGRLSKSANNQLGYIKGLVLPYTCGFPCLEIQFQWTNGNNCWLGKEWIEDWLEGNSRIKLFDYILDIRDCRMIYQLQHIDLSKYSEINNLF